MNNILKTTVIASFAAMLGSVSYAADAAAATTAAPVATTAAPVATTAAQAPATCSTSSEICAYMPSLEKLSVDVSFGVEGNYVFRGKKVANASFQPMASVSYAATDALGIYASVWNNSPLKNSEFNETDINVGATYAIAGFTFDAGYTYYWYNETRDGSMARTNEVKFGVSYNTSAIAGKLNSFLSDLAITPSVYYYYDFDLMANTLEIAVRSSAPITKWIWGKDWVSVDTAVYYGYNTADRGKDSDGFYRSTNSYSYVGAKADLVWKINNTCKASLGVRWAANNDFADGRDEQLIWMGGAISAGF